MSVSPTLNDLIATARSQTADDRSRMADLAALDRPLDAAEAEDLRNATVAVELAAIDVFTLFEARMQHHFRRGPFSRKLVAALRDAGDDACADRVQQYYWAINILKHGRGDSLRAVTREPDSFIVLRDQGDAQDPDAPDTPRPVGLVDVSAAGFFDGLITTIQDAVRFLDKRPTT